MRVKELLNAVERFRIALKEHQELWGNSLEHGIPDFPVENIKKLEKQTDALGRQLGKLRPYLTRFHSSWVLTYPMTGQSWNALEAAVGNTAVAQIKGPSLRACVDNLNQILGKLESLDPEDEIPADPKRPIHAGATADKIIFGYLYHLHPRIQTASIQLYMDGHYAQAVEESSKAVFEYIREVTSLTGDGSALAEAAFSIKKPVLAFSDLADQTKKDEQVGFMEMLKGYFKGVRTPHAHKQGKQEEAQKAFEYLVMASLLCRRVDDARPKPSD